MINRLKY